MSEQPPPVIVFLIDAFRHDFLSDKLTPNLAELAAKSNRLPLRPILGYSDAIRATFFTGRYPDETGYWMEYCYKPDNSPWAGIERFALVDRIPSNLAVRAAKLAASKTVLPIRAKRRGVASLDLRNMPLKAVSKFDFTLCQPMTAPNALSFPSIFDACAASRQQWAYLDASKVRRPGELLDQMSTMRSDVGLIFVYLHQVDMAAHVFGIESAMFWRRVQSTDALFGELMSRARQRFGTIDPIVFSDHGMSVLKRQISIQDLLEHPGFPDRFLVALDATMVRLWFFDDDERLRAEVREHVADRYPGRYLSDSDRKLYHLEFGNRFYGDEMYLLEPGVGIFPNFHSYIKPKAMHAYEPTDRDQWGIFIGPSSMASVVSDPVDLTEVTSVVFKLINASSNDL